MLAFSRTGDSRATLPQALSVMAAEAAALVGVTRAWIWLLDRRAGELWLAASSDPLSPITGARVRADDPESEAALGLRLDRPRRVGDHPAASIVAPLRGWRRALGTLVLDGTPSELTSGRTLERAYEVAGHLSAAIENLQLVAEVVGQHRLLDDSFNSLGELVIVTDTALRVVRTNDAVARCLGRRASDLVSAPLATLVGEEFAAWIAEAEEGDVDVAAPSARARTRTFEDSPLGSRVAATVTPLMSDDHEVLGRVMVCRDVTERLQLEAEGEVLRARLVQAEKLAALGQFVAGVAHEINNPLQGVLGYVELLMRLDKALPVRGELRRVLYEADRAARIVRNLLIFSGSRRMVTRRLAIGRIIVRALASRRASLARLGVEVTARLPDRPASVVGDPLMLEQAILNLLINAEHAVADTGQPGTIDITVELDPVRQAVVIRIHDSGPGIDPTLLKRIFEPFFTTKEVNHGTGLGLTIAHAILQDHGGTIAAVNDADGGARFTIELPAAGAGPSPRRRPKKHRMPDAAESATVRPNGP